MTGQEYNNQFSDEELRNEIWKDIPNYEGCYQVSNLGRVKSLERVVVRKRETLGYLRIPEKMKVPSQDRMGRLFVQLFKCNKNEQYYTYQLVLFAFVGPYPKNMQCCHNDGNIYNNRLSNLRYDTIKNNMADKERHGTKILGSNILWSKLKEKDVLKIRKMYKTGKYFQRELGEMFGVTQTAVGHIVRRQNWKHI